MNVYILGWYSYICDKKMVEIYNDEIIGKRQALLREIDSCRDDPNKLEQLKKSLEQVNSEIAVMTSKRVDNIEKNIKKVVNVPKETSIKDMKKQLNEEYQAIREEYAQLQEKLKANVEAKKVMRDEIKIFDDLRKEEPLTEVSKTKMEHIWERFCTKKAEDEPTPQEELPVETEPRDIPEETTEEKLIEEMIPTETTE